MKKGSAHHSEGPALTVRRALLSVSDKRGLAEFAKEIISFGVEIISTGGTAKILKEAGIAVTSVSDVTGFPEILDGRVKTLHPAIHAGILAVLDNPDHVKQLRENHVEPIDLVVVNLYPFEETVARPNVSQEEALENIDIGGPTLVRASAKNYRHTAVVVNPSRYDDILREMKEYDGAIREQLRYTLACEAFEHTARYDAAIVSYLNPANATETLPERLTIAEPKAFSLRYGENPHQLAAFYGSLDDAFEKLHGKELSFNNISDAYAAVSLTAEFDEPTVVIIKHNNPCGVGSASSIRDAYTKALATDSKSAFGGIVAVNRILDESAAEIMNSFFLEVIIAPDFSEDALTTLMKKKDRRLLKLKSGFHARIGLDIRRVFGGYLVQEQDDDRFSIENVKTVTRRVPTKSELEGLLFAWRVAKHAKSNAIVYALADRTVGIGAGQMSRVDSARIAAMKAADAGLDLKGSAVASDAFFPFADGLLECVKAGATAVIQPGGSVRDQEVIKAADENSVAMVFTGIRHFRH
jgi:phosphoribosylaminoimidazolecarboxamide formyltransferase/IMP cyclohydrolase